MLILWIGFSVFLISTLCSVQAQVDIPLNTVYVTDDLNSYENLVGGVDYDSDNERNLVVRWNFGDAELVDVHIYLEDINYGLLYYIGRTADGTTTSFEWKTNGKYVHPKYKDGPILFASFRFVVVGLITPKKGRIWLYADDTVTLTGPDINYSCPTLPPTPTPLIPDNTIPTPTITPTPKSIILEPYGEHLAITDNLYSTDDISKSWDKDHDSDRELVIHWNSKWNRSNLFLIYIEDQCGSHLLTHIQNNTLHQNTQNWFRWSKDSDVDSPYLQDGPQFGQEYSITIRVYNLSSDSTFSYAYPFLYTSIQFLEGEGNSSTAIYTPTNTPFSTENIRYHELIISDDTNFKENLSGGWDLDAADNREIALYWRKPTFNIDQIQILIGDWRNYKLLHEVKDINKNWFSWSSSSMDVADEYLGGPQFGETYPFLVYFYDDGNVYHYVKANVLFLNENASTPTNTFTPSMTPTSTPTKTPTTQSLPKPIVVTEDKVNNEVTIILPNLPQDAVPLEMVWIPPGEILLGSDFPPKVKSENNRLRYPKQHAVIENGYYIGIYEITNAQFAQFSSDIRHNRGDNYPVKTSWEDAKFFCEWLTQNTPGWKFRLPSEVEWEYACRGGTETRRYWGDDPDDTLICMYENVGDQSIGTFVDCSSHTPGWCSYSYPPFNNCNDGFEGLAPVGSFIPNPFGLFDMLGNLYEMCEDDWHWDYENAPLDGSAWIDEPRAESRVKKGTDYNRYNFVLDVNYSEKILWIYYVYDGFRIVAEKDSENIFESFTQTPTNKPTHTFTPTRTPTEK